ncbi:MAG: hypothetical protein JO357_00965 [Hyphomicrobiales bacterium]|nr:hypothetical protein [Hyphomicrobiales bacterium]MBV9053372.1 hypothetical protein [Hyphomicrobiales bacterium]MBV9135603.1 hypothetical protein [Hyphomicrobiales bacterium]MBV9590898.1 hypothetical protein [Hyphomicrobiales bacterium]MBV9974703.1 hypothetical protein [Hyphomicrobiales bacterium]
MGWLKAGLTTTVISAVLMVGALLLLSVLQKGFEPMSLLSILVVGLPLGLLVAAPVGLVVLPAADAILLRAGARLFRDMAIVGAIAGALVAIIILFVLRFRPASGLGTITALAVLAGLVGGAAAGLFYAEFLARLEKR